jgi:hypothetical protein
MNYFIKINALSLYSKIYTFDIFGITYKFV